MPAPDPRYLVGIDLGTTHTVVSYIDQEAASPTVKLFDVLQMVEAGAVGRRSVLPSFLYLPGPHELAQGSTALPWAPDRTYAVGTFAREQGMRVPGRLVASAKSWLCNTHVDRSADILPWEAPADVPKVSPVEAATRYLQHVREAWNAEQAATPEDQLERQSIILTVPASFDEVARSLTVEAAARAGLGQVILLEEPIAAFYAWLHATPDWRDTVADGQVILVCDVGGGTTDFSVIGVRAEGDDLLFDRLAVGDHLMLGGDNMDHALARSVEAELTGEGQGLDRQRWQQLVHQCRRAKETLLQPDAPQTAEVAVAGQGSNLIGGTLRHTLRRSEVEALVLEGFFPEVGADAEPSEDRRAGLAELGLPYAQDPAITRYLAAFWRQSEPYIRKQTGRDTPYPDHILFNGGVFNAGMLRERTQAIVGSWFEETAGDAWQPTELPTVRLDHNVAVGAASYGRVRQGEGTRVGSGSPRAYYVGIAGEATDDDTTKAVCLVPRGAPEGYEVRLQDRTFEALANQPVTFHLLSSSTRTGDQPGQVVTLESDEALALPPIRTVLAFGKRYARTVPVQLEAHLTEVGTLTLWCASVNTDHRWQLQFDVRQSGTVTPDDATDGEDVITTRHVEKVREAIQRTFEDPEREEPPSTVWNWLETLVHRPPEEWPLPFLRACADRLLHTRRDRSAAHEKIWLDLLGYCLRPGYGDAVDAWRMQQAWVLHLEGLRFPDEKRNRVAWWHFWRRVSGGLAAGKQEQIYYEARPFIQPEVRTRKEHRVYHRRMEMSEKEEAWKALATFERMKPDLKTTLAKLLLDKFRRSSPRGGELWALSRLGTRHPLHGPLDRRVPVIDVEAWLEALLGMDLPSSKDAAYALAHLARRTPDRDRGVSAAIRDRVATWLDEHMSDPAPYHTLLRSPEPLGEHPGEAWFVAEPLPQDAATTVHEPRGIMV
ncbi:MAG: Hsp70 family protein [Bacteroidetes bacterium]|jgi:hypothetical protein|nr:Hsp70 family protein [Bacteroidota bacterium]